MTTHELPASPADAADTEIDAAQVQSGEPDDPETHEVRSVASVQADLEQAEGNGTPAPLPRPEAAEVEPAEDELARDNPVPQAASPEPGPELGEEPHKITDGDELPRERGVVTAAAGSTALELADKVDANAKSAGPPIATEGPDEISGRSGFDETVTSAHVEEILDARPKPGDAGKGPDKPVSPELASDDGEGAALHERLANNFDAFRNVIERAEQEISSSETSDQPSEGLEGQENVPVTRIGTDATPNDRNYIVNLQAEVDEYADLIKGERYNALVAACQLDGDIDVERIVAYDDQTGISIREYPGKPLSELTTEEWTDVSSANSIFHLRKTVQAMAQYGLVSDKMSSGNIVWNSSSKRLVVVNFNQVASSNTEDEVGKDVWGREFLDLATQVAVQCEDSGGKELCGQIIAKTESYLAEDIAPFEKGDGSVKYLPENLMNSKSERPRNSDYYDLMLSKLRTPEQLGADYIANFYETYYPQYKKLPDLLTAYKLRDIALAKHGRGSDRLLVRADSHFWNVVQDTPQLSRDQYYARLNLAFSRAFRDRATIPNGAVSRENQAYTYHKIGEVTYHRLAHNEGPDFLVGELSELIGFGLLAKTQYLVFPSSDREEHFGVHSRKFNCDGGILIRNSDGKIQYKIPISFKHQKPKIYDPRKQGAVPHHNILQLHIGEIMYTVLNNPKYQSLWPERFSQFPITKDEKDKVIYPDEGMALSTLFTADVMARDATGLHGKVSPLEKAFLTECGRKLVGIIMYTTDRRDRAFQPKRTGNGNK